MKKCNKKWYKKKVYQTNYICAFDFHFRICSVNRICAAVVLIVMEKKEMLKYASFLPPDRIVRGGYCDEPGVHPSVRPSVNMFVSAL